MLNEIITAAARAAIADGVEPSEVKQGSALHQWIVTNVDYSPETEFYVVFLIACEIAKLKKTV